MPSRPINKLVGTKTAELSLVPRGANGRRVAMTKEHDMSFDEVLKQVLATEAEGEADHMTALAKSGVEGDALEAARAQFRMMSGFSDQLSVDDLAAIGKAAGYDIAKAVKPEEGVRDDKTRARSGKPDPKASQTDRLGKEAQQAVDEVRKELDDERSARVALEKQIGDMQRDSIRKEFVTRCEKEFSHVPGKTAEQLADILLQSSEPVRKELEEMWASMSETVKKSDLIRGAGTPGGGHSGAAGHDQLTTIAKELMAKDKELTYAKAYDQAYRENPQHYQDYLAENPAQSSRH